MDGHYGGHGDGILVVYLSFIKINLKERRRRQVMHIMMIKDHPQIQQMILPLIKQEIYEMNHCYQIQQIILQIFHIMDQHFSQWQLNREWLVMKLSVVIKLKKREEEEEDMVVMKDMMREDRM